jgi:PAS domain S-box-containing protein
MKEENKDRSTENASFESSHSDAYDCTLYEKFIENMPGVLFMLQSDGRFVRWNNCIRDQIIGKTNDEISSINASDIVHPDDRELMVRKTARVLERGAEEGFEIRLLLNGSRDFRWFLITADRIVIDGKSFLIGIGADITDRKSAEQKLIESEQKLRFIFKQINAPVFITDTSGNIIYVSPGIENVSGYTQQEFLGRPFSEFLEGQAIEQGLTMFNDVLSEPSVSLVREFRLRKKDGIICYADVKLQYYHGKDSDGTIGVIYELTHRKRFEALTALRLRLLQLVETLSVEELLGQALDEAERFTDSTFGFFHLLTPDQAFTSQRIWSNRVRKHMQRRKGAGLSHPQDEVELWREAVETKQAVINNDYRKKSPPGFPERHRPLLRNSLVVPVVEADRAVAVFVVGNKLTSYDADDAQWVGTLADLAWDIIARKRAEESERRMHEVLMQVQKMELVGQLAGGIAHDFNNMLGVILGNTEIALSTQDLDESLRTNLNGILKAAERSAELTSQLLAFARKQTVIPKVLDLNEAVNGTLGMLHRLIGADIVVSWVPDRRPCFVRMDPSQLDQILINLCVNARDAITGTGKITIETSRRHLDHPTPLFLTSMLPGDYAVLSVADTGNGIKAEHAAHIIEPFFTTKELGKGTGLGLSTVYGIVKQNKGYLDFESEPSKGTIFRIYLPLHRATDSTARNVSIPAQIQKGAETILIAEDEPEILNLCRLMLEKTGYRVLPASSPVEALRLAAEWQGSIDLLLSDVIMTEMNGRDLSAQLSALIPGLKTLFMSGYPADIIGDHGMLDTSIHFIQKPFTLLTLTKKVREVLKGEVSVSGS